MDKERADYDDRPNRRRRPWSSTEVGILLVAAALASPAILVAVSVIVWMFLARN